MPAVLFNNRIQIWPKSKRNISQVIPLQALSEDIRMEERIDHLILTGVIQMEDNIN